MKLDAPTPEDVRHVAARMRERDQSEFLAVSHARTHAELVEALVARYGGAGDAICAYWNGPVAIGAMVQHRPNVVTLAFFATDQFPEIALGLTKFIKDRLFPRYRANGVHRIECLSMEGYDAAHRWIGVLGLKREATLPKFGKAGETFLQFAWVADAD